MKQTITENHDHNPGQDNNMPATAGTTYGYVRVSTREQNEARQINAMRSFGIPADHIFVDKQSGKDFQRPEYQRLFGLLHLLDTRSARDLTDSLIADIVLQLLPYVAETEHAFIRQRQAEGVAAAKARGQSWTKK